MDYRKNDYVTVTIEDIGNDGEGIGKVDGFTLFVKDAVIGDKVEAKIVKAKKHYAYARLERVLEPSPYRVTPVCHCHRQCGGCQLQALSYEKQLEFKQQKLRNNLIRIGGFAPEYVDQRMEPIVGMETPLYYRNKALYPVGTDKDGNVITGFYAGRTHSIIANTKCHLGAKENQQILELILAYMQENNVTAYQEETGEGLVRHVLIRKGFTSGEIMVCLVINRKLDAEKLLPAQEKLLQKLETVPGMTSVSVCSNTERTNVVMGTQVRTIWGKPTITDTIHVRDTKKADFPLTGQELTFAISPLSFYQVNPVQTEKLYSLALEYADLTGSETVWDLYCGIGTISLFLARSAKQVCGVEIIPQAIDDARENAVRNGIENASFFVGKAEEVLPAFYGARGTTEDGALKRSGTVGLTVPAQPDAASASENTVDMRHPDVIVVDPPRKGCDPVCLETMLKMQPERIVYVSCDSATLARDLKVLCEGGYEVKRVRGVDQFGMTVGVETIVLLSKLKSSKHIEVELKMDELDLTAAESKATYEEIKDYVLENSGLKVSSLYIAQVKQKYGIIERENYNKSQNNDSKQPVCPTEKEEAIKDAFRHFKMF